MPSARRANKIGLVLVAPIALLAAIELGFRVFVTQDALVYQDSLDQELGFELRPGVEGVKSGARVRINADGLRERAIDRAKAKGEYRVVIVGDHPAFGLGVAEEDAFVRRLEGLVRPPRGARLVVINVSMYQYSLDQKLALLKRRGLAYEPDVVVFQIGTQTGFSMPAPLLPWPRLKNFARAHLASLRWALERLYWARPPASSEEEPEPQYAVIERALKAFRLIVDESGAESLVVYVPELNWNEPRADTKTAAAVYRKVCAQLGVPYVDVSSKLGGDPKRFLLKPDAAFLNADGHRASAQAIAPALQKVIRSPRKRVGRRPQA